MPRFEIKVNICMGWTHSGPVYKKANGHVELTDQEVSTLQDLIRQQGATDVAALQLQTRQPHIYAKLDAACQHTAYIGQQKYWLIEGLNEGCYDDRDPALRAYCTEHCDYHPCVDEEDFRTPEGIDQEALQEDLEFNFHLWLLSYLDNLTAEEVITFFRDHLNAEAEVDIDDVEYQVVLPTAITNK